MYSYQMNVIILGSSSANVCNTLSSRCHLPGRHARHPVAVVEVKAAAGRAGNNPSVSEKVELEGEVSILADRPRGRPIAVRIQKEREVRAATTQWGLSEMR